ncbi:MULTISPECIES: ABC transporter substrate-binding protein [unclassified Chelatococcus]|uniref:ABC transporter substrate-binding protein n=1 Tax=unclassified Chelatococcus TaxID=2638111 RepID=UPI001BCD0933|nr:MULTISPECIES: ABC transporter substrate-binding protein [unclassified Chelatococcus]MBS7700286.1 ABC transporter substrate-binding protein [Chelatococcus sp. YT9]MBX3558257.1 ABC transporter substrate-binding protein [Chelatococcus sp.]
MTNDFRKPSVLTTGISRRGVLLGAAAGAGVALGGRAAWAQPKLSPPNIIKQGTLVMSTNPTLPPLQFVDQAGEVQGMRIELGKELAKALGLTPEYVKVEFATMVPGLASRRWDMINTGIFWTEERSKLMYMIPYERAAISFLVPFNNPKKIEKWQDMAGLSVGVELGGIEERRTREVDKMLKDAGLAGITIRVFNNFSEAFQALRAGQVDAATSIDATAQFMQNRKEFHRAVSGLFPQTATFAFANKQLADASVDALNGLRKSGYYDELLAKYGVLTIEEPLFAIKSSGPA